MSFRIRFYHLLLCLLVGFCFSPKQAEAQINEFGLRQRLNLSQPPVKNPPEKPLDNGEHLLGSWGGIRPWLVGHGIDFLPAYMLEAAGNTSGGLSQGSEYVGRFGLNTIIDGDKLAGIGGLKLNSLLIMKSGRDLSNDRLGHDPYSVMELYGSIGTLVKLQFLYFSQDLMNKHIQFGLGRISQALFFDSSPIYCNFLSLALCAVPRVLPGANFNGFYNSAKTNWGAYFRYRPVAPLYLQIGAFEASPMHGGHSGFNWSSNRDIGANIPFQAGWEPGGGKGQKPSHIVLGGYYDTAPYADIYRDKTGQPVSRTGGAGHTNHGHTAFWVQLDHMMWRNASPSNAGMVVFGNFTRSNMRSSVFRQQGSLGFEDIAQIPGRPKDGFGVQVTYAWASVLMKRKQREYQDIHHKHLKSLYGRQSHEIIIEAQYSLHLYRGLDIQPDFQYIVHPNFQRAIANAVVLAGRGRVSF